MKGEISGKHITAIPQSLLYSKVCLASGLLLLLPKLAKKKTREPSLLFYSSSLLLSDFLHCSRMHGQPPFLSKTDWQSSCSLAACSMYIESSWYGCPSPLWTVRENQDTCRPLSLVPYFFNSTRDPLQYGKCGCQYGMHGCLVCEVCDSIPQNLSYSHGISLLKIQPLGVLRFSPCTIHDLLQKYN